MICVTRSNPEESVLTLCKHASIGSSPQNGFTSCFTQPCNYCDTFGAS